MTTPAPSTAMTAQPSAALTEIYGDKNDLFALSNRIKSMVPGGDKLSGNEALALSQVSLVTGLNPFIGEVWYIPTVGPMIGIKGARRLEIQDMQKKNGTSFPEFYPCPADEAGATDVNEVAAAFRCEIFDSAATAVYQKMLLETITTLRNCGSSDPVKEAREIVGPRPRWVGWGFSTKMEKSKMNKTALARKRAEADALKKRIVVPFGASISPDEISPAFEVVDAEAFEAKPAPEPRTRSQNIDELLGTSSAATKYKTTSMTVITRMVRTTGAEANELTQIITTAVAKGEIPAEVTLAEADEIAKRLNV